MQTLIGISIILLMLFTLLPASLKSMEQIRNERLKKLEENKGQ